MSNIHPTAIVEDGVTLGNNVTIGAYCIVSAPVVLEDDVVLRSHVVVEGNTRIGKGTTVFSFAVIGSPTPDRKYKGEDSPLVIGQNNLIREYVTIHGGTASDTSGRHKTIIGDNNLIMERVHVAHDVLIGNHCTIVNSVQLGGHTVVEDWVTIGGMTGVKQRSRIGAHAMIGACCKVEKDVVPYSLIRGDDSWLDGINIIGLQRRNFSQDQIKTLMKAMKQLFSGEGTLRERVAQMKTQYADSAEVQHVLDFVQEGEGAALCQPLDKAA